MTAPIRYWLTGPLPQGAAAVLDRVTQTPGVLRVAVMPDVHLAGDFCVGAVVATAGLIFPTAVGGDIGCGMLALKFDAHASLLADEARAAKLLAALYGHVPGRRHHRKLAPKLPPTLSDMPLSTPRLAQQLRTDAALEFGTLGAGNHFLELQRDESDGSLWLMVHTGSRCFGQAVFHHHIARANLTQTRLHALDAESDAGRAYLVDLACARAYARENRLAVAAAAAKSVEHVLAVGPLWETLLDCDHNHLQLEALPDGPALVHRKGATRAHEGEPGIVPGSMGDYSFHTAGRGCAEALHSSSHGAGRLLSRTQARQKVTVPAMRQRIRGVWYDRTLERSLIEESPQAYKPIAEVMRAQAELTRIERQMKGVLVYKAR